MNGILVMVKAKETVSMIKKYGCAFPWNKGL